MEVRGARQKVHFDANSVESYDNRHLFPQISRIIIFMAIVHT